jgi:RsiW-degrading membrane proteinase PrsW (M82 family)
MTSTTTGKSKIALPLMALAWLLVAGLTVRAVVLDLAGVLPLFVAPWTLDPWLFLIYTDFLVELILVLIFVHWDATRRGKNPWGWVIAGAFLGAVSTVGYLILRTRDKEAPSLLPR